MTAGRCSRVFVALVCGASVAAQAAAGVKLIIDTDAGFDVDDVGAISIGNALQDAGEAEIVAVGHTNGFVEGIGGVSALMEFYGRGDVPLGAYKGPWAHDPNAGKGTADKYLSDLVDGYPRVVKSSAQVNDTVTAYRRVLAAQPDHSVHIASIGITTNMRDLVQSKPDGFSPLGGAALIAQKVKLVVWMDMMYNFGCAQAASSNWLGPDTGCRGSAQAAVMGWPASVKQLFMPMGGDVTSGDWLTGCAGLGNPVRQAYEDWAGPNNGRWSWDPITVMIAVRGVGGVHCEEYDEGQGHMEVNEAGEENWVSGGGGVSNQSRVRYAGKGAQAAIAFELNQLMCKPPGPWSNDTWTKGAGMNCYGARGKSPAHGATDLESPPGSSCGDMTLPECQQRCVATPGCTSITVAPASSGKLSCYRKADVELGHCDAGTGFSTYTRRGWTLVQGYNCWPGHGARDLGGSLGTMGVRDCQQQCEQTKGCSAIVWEGKPHSGVGGCFAKADIELAKCDKGTAGFDTYLAYKAW